MIKKFLSLLIFLMTFSVVNGQISSLAIVGAGTSQGWPTGAVGEVDAAQLTSTDGINWTATNLTLLGGPIKFRANNSWTPTTNWGGSSFPSGTGLLDGVAITSVAGIYNVTFNTSTLAYAFELQNITFPVIGAIGNATSGGWNVDTDMSTLDGIHYTLNRVQLLPGDVKFRENHEWTNNWGGATFPTGVAIFDGPASTIPSAATYNVSFNLLTLEYSFSFTTLALVGDATGAWPNDPQIDPIQFTTTDGVHYSLNDVVLANGYAKFRANNSWAVNWGASVFPSGTAILDDPASIYFPAGTYDITFNMTTGEYTIIQQQNEIISIIGNATAGGWESDTDMSTTDGINYSLEVSLLSGALKFRQNHDWAVNWSSASFPSGIGSVDSDAIVVNTPGVYNISFNRVTGAYSFVFVQSFPLISIIGNATAGGWESDTDMSTTDGINYSLEVSLLSGAIKFRQNHDWAVNWSSASFPSGIGSVDSDAIVVDTPGIYNVSFNRVTGAYSFVFVQSIPVISIIGNATAGGWESDTDMSTTDGINYSLEVSLLSGALKFRQNHDWAVNWSSASFPSGIGSVDSDAIVVDTPGVYNVSFNRVTGAYSFVFVQSFPVISIIGNATAGGWESDTDMSTTDGINYSLEVSLLSGDLKFRQNHDWPINWSSASFPNGIGSVDNIAIPITPAGIYGITFNRISGEYTFTISTFTYFIDADADGYNNGTAILYVSSAPTGYSTTTLGTDCDDSNAAVYPGATEVANGYDDNCDGIIDIGTTPVAPIVSNITYCKGAIATALTATAFPGYTLKWFTVTTNATTLLDTYTLIAAGTPTPSTSTVGTKKYAVSQILSDGIESPKAIITVNVLALPTEVLGSITSNTESTVTPGTYLAATTAVGKFVGTSETVSYRIAPFVGSDLTYYWTVPTGVNIVSQDDNVLTVNFLNVSTGVGPIGNITVQAQNANGCRTAAKTLAVSKVLPTAPASIKMTDASLPIPTTGIATAVTTFGQYMGTTKVLTLTATPSLTATSYEWELPTGVNLLSSNGNVITVNFAGVTSSNTTNYTSSTGVSTNSLRIGVKSVNGVGVSVTSNSALINPTTTSTAKLLTLTATAPKAPVLKMTNDAVSTTTSVTVVSKFIGTTTEFTLTSSVAVGASSYEWILPTGVNVTFGNPATDRIIKVNFAGVSSGVTTLYIGARSKNGIGTSDSSTLNSLALAPYTNSPYKLLKLTAAVPAAVSIVTGQIAGVCGGSTYSYTMTASALANSYVITAPIGSVVTSASNPTNTTNVLSTTDLTFSVTYPVGFVGNTTLSPKTVAITSVNGVGNSLTNKTLVITTAMPVIGAATGSAGITTFSRCDSQSFTVPTVVGATNYVWTPTNGAVILSGQGTNSVEVDFSAVPSSVTSIKITIVAINACGVSSAVKTITLSSLSCTFGKSEESLTDSSMISIYPNPARDNFTLELNASQAGEISMAIYNINGALIRTKNVQLTEGNNLINEDISSLASGIYFVQIYSSSNEEPVVKKIVKQ